MATKKRGRNKVKCETYRKQGRREKNKALKAKRRANKLLKASLKKHPEDIEVVA